MSVRRVKVAQECITSHNFTNGRTGMSPISIRNRRAIFLGVVLIVLVECVSIVVADGNTEHEIDKIHGRPNIEPANPARPEDGATAYRRDDVHRKSESHAPKLGAARHYDNGNHNGEIGHPNHMSWGKYQYTDENGCEKNIQYVHWPVLGYQKSNKEEAHPPAYGPPEYSPDDYANANDHYDRANHNYDHNKEYEQAQPIESEESNYANIDANDRYDSKSHYGPRYVGNYEDYIPKPAGGYGFKKLVVPVHDVYNQKAYRPPRFDLSDLVFPVEESPNYANPLPYSGGYDNVATLPHGYGDSNPQPDNVEYVGNAVDNFGNLPYKEKYTKPNYPAPALPYNSDTEEDYSPKGRDEFGMLPYKESSGPSKSFAGYGAAPYENQPTVSSNGDARSASIKEKLGGGRAADSEHSDEPTEAEKEMTTESGLLDLQQPPSTPEINFRSELDSISDIDENESRPGEDVLSEDFLKGSNTNTLRKASSASSTDESFKNTTTTPHIQNITNESITNDLYINYDDAESSTLITTTQNVEISTSTEKANASANVLQNSTQDDSLFTTIITTISAENTTPESTRSSSTEMMTLMSTTNNSVPTTTVTTTTAVKMSEETTLSTRNASSSTLITTTALTSSTQVTIKNKLESDKSAFSPNVSSLAIPEKLTMTNFASNETFGEEGSTNTTNSLMEDSAAATATASSVATFDASTVATSLVSPNTTNGTAAMVEHSSMTTINSTTATSASLNTSATKNDSTEGRDKRNVSQGPFKPLTFEVKSKPKEFVGMRSTILPEEEGPMSTPANSGDTASPAPLTSATVVPTVIFAITTTTPSSAPSILTVFQTVDLMSAIARAEQERQKLPEPGPSVPCGGTKSAIGSCSAFFKCDATEELFSCWANGGDDETAELVFDQTSHECRKFSAIKECKREAFCEGKQSLELVGGNCTRLAHNCGNNDLVNCKGPEMVINPLQGGCAPMANVEACQPILRQLSNA